MDILFGIVGEEEKGKSSYHLTPQLAVLNGMDITNTRYSIFLMEKSGLNILDGYYLIFTQNSTSLCY